LDDRMGNSSEDKAEEKEDGWDDGLAGGHCRKSKELSLESLGLKQETGNLDAGILFPVPLERIRSKTEPFFSSWFCLPKRETKQERRNKTTLKMMK